MSIFSGWSDFPFVVQSANLRPMGEGRTEGLHLSDIIRQMKIAEGEKVTGIAGEQDGLRAWEGFAEQMSKPYFESAQVLTELPSQKEKERKVA